ncbi:MAG: multiheme c-type cytochrome, partial [Myxococcota bacterium]
MALFGGAARPGSRGGNPRVMRARWLWVTALFACGAEVEATDKHVEEKLAVVLPRPPGDLAPSHLRVLGAIEEDLSDVERCAPCHADVVAQWRSSAHARASFGNPWYRATIDAFREERGFEASRFCAGCHDLALLVDGAMDEAIDPADRRAHVGVTCLVCHSMQERYADGNGSFALRIAPAPLPDPNSAAQVAAHRERMNPPGLRTSGQCGGCHRSFLGGEMGNPHHLPGIDDIGAWRSSAFAESNARQIDEVEPATCQQCHMSQEEALRDFAATEGRVASHRVRGAHTPLREDHALRDAVTIDIAAAHVEGEWILPAEDATPRGSEMAVDLVIRNVGAGHRFPGGTRDLQYTYVDIEVRDARGRVLGRITGDDAFRFRAALVNEEGAIEETHFVDRFRAAAFDRTRAPRDAIVLRAITALPRRLALPLTVHAAVRHQRHPPAMRELACEATRSARGEAFARASAALGRTPLDGCAPEPVTTVAETTRVMGAVNAGAVNAGAVNAGAVNAGAVNAGAVNAGAV